MIAFWLSEEFNPFCIVSIYLPCSINLNKLKSNLKTDSHASLPGQLSCFPEWPMVEDQLTLQSPLALEVLSTVLTVIPMGRTLDIHKSLGTKEIYSGCRGSCPMSLRGCFLLSWEGNGDWEFAGGKETSHLLSGRARRRIWGAAG